jgi:formate hydrogenlyase transcriptional activator
MADRDILLLGELADALGGVHTIPATGRAFVQAVRRHLPLRWFELGKRDGQGQQASFHATLFDPESPSVVVSQATRSGSEVPLRDSGDEAVRHYSRRPRSPSEISLDVLPRQVLRSFQGEGTLEELLVVPFFAEGALVGYAALALGCSEPPLLVELKDAVANLLRVAWRHLMLVERVAGLSRRAHVETQHLRSELQRVSEPERLVSVSEASRRILSLVDLVAGHDTTVLLRGESGTGKEVIARRIHRLSARANRPFLRVNCGALPEGLLESTLFGHERGAFTGASTQHRGLFERAHGGTLLLDEVAELPPRAQAKLLRVLQEGEIERVGGENTYSVDVRLIAATHQPLEQMIAGGTFRSDLYYRLNIFPITLPPLRERLADLPVLAETLLERLAQRHGRLPPRFLPEVMDRLTRHSWPGNVRELENLLERALILTPGREPLALPPEFVGLGTAAQTRPTAGSTVLSLDMALRQAIERALHESGGQIYGERGAAALLGVKPTTLQSKMRKLGIARGRFAPA